MLRLTQYFLRVGFLLLVAGAAAGTYGGMRLHQFLTESPIVGVPTTWQFAKWVVLPPVLITLGLGFLIFGVIMIGKGLHFHVSQARDAQGTDTRDA